MPANRRIHRRYPPRGEASHVAVRRLAEAVLACGDHDARRETLEVPFPWPAGRLVEVVDVEHEPPLGLAKTPKLARCASPHSWALSRLRRVCEVVGHDRRRSAQERERRGEHPADADRDEVRQATFVRGVERRDDVRPVVSRLPLAVEASRDVRPPGPSACERECRRTVRRQCFRRVIDHAGTSANRGSAPAASGPGRADRTASSGAAAAYSRGSGRRPSRRPSSPARRCCRW